MEGIHAVGHDIGEGLFLVLLDLALRQGAAVLADRPELQIRGTVRGVLGRGDEFQTPVVIQIGHSVEPGQLADGLLELVHILMDKLELGVDIGKSAGGDGYGLRRRLCGGRGILRLCLRGHSL